MAKSTDWGLTDAGFRRPTYAELLDAIEYKARELFGEDANLTVRSPLGIFLRIFAWALNLVFSTIEDVYNSRFIDTAVGSSLLNLGRAIGLRLQGAQKAVGYLTFYGDAGVEIPEGYLAETVIGQQYITLQSGVIEADSITLPASAVVPGPDGNTDAGSVNIITNPMGGVISVTNAAPFEGGKNTETDAEFRSRYYASTDFAGGVNLDAIEAAILQDVKSVVAVTGDENDSDVTDELGLPPHSIELVVYGGLDEEIAAVIHKRKSAGIQTFGNVSVSVADASGRFKTIKFSRPTPVNVWVKVYGLKTDSTFPLDGVEQIKQRIIDFIGSDTRSGLNIGQSVICISIPTEVFKVQGVVDFDLQISSNGTEFGWSNVEISAREKAVTNESMVVVA